MKEALFEFGFVQCHCANSTYLYEKDTDFMLSTNVVDDELIATNNNELRLRFLQFLQKQFDVEDMGMAH